MKKIRLLGQNRSGTTFLLNVLNIIFGENNVNANHKVQSNIQPPNIVAFRDIRDSFVSISRAHSKITTNDDLRLPVPFEAIKTKEGIDEILKFYHTNYMLESSIECVKVLNDNSDKLVLRYEDFFNNFDYLFSKLEDYFNIEISDDIKKTVIDETSLGNMIRIQESVPDFATFDEKTMIHGNHIFKGEVNGWREIIPTELHSYLTEKLNVQLKGLGYES